MYEDNEQYCFIHRSFQEYFCALHFSKQNDEVLRKFGNFVEKRQIRNFENNAFDMLYDMIPTRVEKCIFTPYLSKLFADCNSSVEDCAPLSPFLYCYWMFLQEIYPMFYYSYGNVGVYYLNESASYLYDFIVKKKGFNKDTPRVLDVCFDGMLDKDDVLLNEKSPYRKFVIEEYVYADIDGYGNEELVDKFDADIEELIFDRDGEEIDKFDSEGCNLELNIYDILSSSPPYNDLINIMNDDEFPFMKEYCAVCNYFKGLKEAQEFDETDLF